jgi:hypothetical protein
MALRIFQQVVVQTPVSVLEALTPAGVPTGSILQKPVESQSVLPSVVSGREVVSTTAVANHDSVIWGLL